MSTLAVKLIPLAQTVEFSDSDMIVNLVDGRKIFIPLIWFPTLSGASKEQLSNYELLGDGEGIHWPDLDEDLSVNGLLIGTH